MLIQEEKKFEFRDFYISKLGYQGSKTVSDLEKGDIVIDENGIPGKVKLVSIEHGNLIEFVDGYTTFDTGIKLRKLFANGATIYNYQKRYFNLITKLGRIIEQNVADTFPYTHMMNNGDNIWIRGSTLQGIVDKFSHQNFNDGHSLFVAKLTPPYKFNIETFELKSSLRRTRFVYTFAKSLFIDIDLGMNDKGRIKYNVLDKNKYNKKHWDMIVKQFSKFKIKYNNTDLI